MQNQQLQALLGAAYALLRSRIKINYTIELRLRSNQSRYNLLSAVLIWADGRRGNLDNGKPTALDGRGRKNARFCWEADSGDGRFRDQGLEHEESRSLPFHHPPGHGLALAADTGCARPGRVGVCAWTIRQGAVAKELAGHLRLSRFGSQ